MPDDSKTTNVMFRVQGDGITPPTLQTAAEQLSVDVANLDADYGVRVIDLMDHIYVVRGRVAHSDAHADPEISVLGD